MEVERIGEDKTQGEHPGDRLGKGETRWHKCTKATNPIKAWVLHTLWIL